MSINVYANDERTFKKPAGLLADAQHELKAATYRLNLLLEEEATSLDSLQSSTQELLDSLGRQKYQTQLAVHAAEVVADVLRTDYLFGEMLEYCDEAEKENWEEAELVVKSQNEELDRINQKIADVVAEHGIRCTEVKAFFDDEYNVRQQRVLAAASRVNGAQNESENTEVLQSVSSLGDSLTTAQDALDDATHSLHFLITARDSHIYQEKVISQEVLDRLEWQKNQARLAHCVAEEVAEELRPGQIRREIMDYHAEAEQRAAWDVANQICRDRLLEVERTATEFSNAHTELNNRITEVHEVFDVVIDACRQCALDAASRVNAAKNDAESDAESDALLMDDFATVSASAAATQGTQTLSVIAQPADDQGELDMSDCDAEMQATILASIFTGGQLSEQQANDPAMSDCDADMQATILSSIFTGGPLWAQLANDPAMSDYDADMQATILSSVFTGRQPSEQQANDPAVVVTMNCLLIGQAQDDAYDMSRISSNSANYHAH